MCQVCGAGDDEGNIMIEAIYVICMMRAMRLRLLLHSNLYISLFMFSIFSRYVCLIILIIISSLYKDIGIILSNVIMFITGRLQGRDDSGMHTSSMNCHHYTFFGIPHTDY